METEIIYTFKSLKSLENFVSNNRKEFSDLTASYMWERLNGDVAIRMSGNEFLGWCYPEFYDRQSCFRNVPRKNYLHKKINI